MLIGNSGSASVIDRRPLQVLHFPLLRTYLSAPSHAQEISRLSFGDELYQHKVVLNT